MNRHKNRFVCLPVLLYYAAILATGSAQETSSNKYGRPIGALSNFAHGITGTVYAVSDDVLFIKGFSYDGTGPDAYFWAGNSSRPAPTGFIIPFPADFTGREAPILGRFDNEDVLLKLPMGVKVRDIRWLSVWCRRFTVDFGSVQFPDGVNPPKPRELPEFKRLAHGLRSGKVTILDSKTFYISDLHYDGAAPDAFFWVGTGPEPSSQGIKVPNELGTYEVLRGYQGEDIEIQLPGNLTVYDIDWLAMWCISFRENFGHVLIPKDLDVPPALGQNKLTTTTVKPKSTSAAASSSGVPEFDSCLELLNGRMQVQWESVVDGVIIRLSARMAENEYMAFGISGTEGRSQMVGGDVVVAYFNTADNAYYASDYYLSAKSQCDGTNGVCPDERIGGQNDAQLLHGQRKDGVTTVVYQRRLGSAADRFDRTIPTVGKVNVIAAIGPLNSRKEANYHGSDRTGPQEDNRIDFTSRDTKKCSVLLAPEDSVHFPDEADHDYPIPVETSSTTSFPVDAWKPQIISGEHVFTARIGPTGGKKGYTAITGQPSWGISWFINDLLIPEIYVERGQTYTFIVEGGDDPTNSARYHPLYITDNYEGGYGQKSAEQQRQQKVYAGVNFDSRGFPIPTAAGRLCEWKHKSVDKWAESASFEDYKKTLKLECDPGISANLTWTVPFDAPSALYYQCYTHNSLGWKINVVDPGVRAPQRGSASVLSTSFSSLLLCVALALSAFQW